jgi:hypothetical protein
MNIACSVPNTFLELPSWGRSKVNVKESRENQQIENVKISTACWKKVIHFVEMWKSRHTIL